MDTENKNELSSSHSAGPITSDSFDDNVINDILMAGDKSKGGRPYFFNDPAVERVLNITLAVATELAVVRERLDTMERILINKGLVTLAEIEDFQPNEEQAEQRQLWHARYAARIMRIVQQEIEAVNHPENNVDMQQIADEINEM